MPIFAFRIKGIRDEAWRIFTIEMKNFEKNKIYEKLPKIEKSKDGNYIMRWDNGMKLSEFIELLNFFYQ
ncbi:MAG: hypothetical protein QXF32_03710 [Candidatus Thermoplasmatota archaeon]